MMKESNAELLNNLYNELKKTSHLQLSNKASALIDKCEAILREVLHDEGFINKYVKDKESK